MPKKSSSRKRGIQRGLPRPRVCGKVRDEGEDDEREGSQFLYFSRSKLSSFGVKCFNVLLAACERFHIIGFTRAANGEYVPLSRKDRIWHYITIFFCLAVCMHKAWVTVHVFLYEELRVESFMCLCVALAYILGACIGVGVVMKPKEIMDLYNSWAQISASLEKLDPGSNKFHPLDNISACLKIISGFVATQELAFTYAILSLFMSDLPVFLFPTVQRFGLVPEGILPNWAWQLMFAPLEWIMAQPYMLMAAFSADFVFMHTGLLHIYLRQLRNINVRGMQSRRRLEQMYVQLEVFNRIAQVWIRFFFPPWLFAVSVAAIIAIFVAIRYTALPLIFYVNFPCAGMTLILMIFRQSYDMFRVIRASEEVLGRLSQHEASYFQGITRAKRVELMKRSKAMRPLVFSMGDSEFSVYLPISVWEEILNQILFLLSL